MKTFTLLAATALIMTLSACDISDDGDDPVPTPNDAGNSGNQQTPGDSDSTGTDTPGSQEPTTPDTQTPGVPTPENPGTPAEPATPGAGSATNVTIDPPTYRADSIFVPNPSDIGDYNAFYTLDGYATPDVIRMDVVVDNVTQGVCTIDDQSGCTLADVIADVDGNDDFKVEIPVHASGDGLPDDGELTNATLRQRGNTARNGPQKSFRLKLDSKKDLWRNERRLQLNKNPFEPTRFKNKLAFDLFQNVPHFPSLRTQFVNMWIDNGQGLEDFGLFTHTEFIGKEYVNNRGLGEDDNLYKIEFFRFSQGDLNSVQVDAAGAPLDEEAFASRLEIENGKDHRMVVKMLESMVDPERSLESVLDQHFNRNNVLTWLATNLILRQADAVTHNFYLYNPAGTEMFYILPWDYDGTFETEQVLTNSFDNEQLQQRKFYGYARGLSSEFVDRFYRLPGAHEQLVRAIDELRTNYYSDEMILEHATTLNGLVEPYLTRLPDSEHVIYEPQSPQRLVTVINQNYTDITTNYAVPIEPTIKGNPTVDAAGLLQLEWEPAYDVTNSGTISYDLIVSTSPYFEPENWVFSDVGIADVPDALVSYPVNTSALPAGRVYVRLIARSSSDPTRFWQTNSNSHRLPDGTDLFGMLAVDLP